MKTLIVEDDRILADVLAFAMRREGFQVVQAHDGLSGVHCWAQENPDLILLDINLPDLDGFAVCQRIRRESNTPIILLSVRDGEEDLIYGLEMGADGYLTKPVSPRQLLALARALLRRGEHRRARAAAADKST